MVGVSGFSFIRNALEGGYPIVEAIWSVWPYVDEMIIVDCQSTDGTTELLRQMGVTVIEGQWENKAGETLADAHALHQECQNDIILHFEGDEVYDQKLINAIIREIELGIENIAVYRLQLEQNFQRCRWYPEPVHRVFPKGSVIKRGHTTDRHRRAKVLPPEYGFLWDVTNCFRDQWMQRIKNQAELWNSEPQYLAVPEHFNLINGVYEDGIEDLLKEDHWTWVSTPFDIPEILKPLVGKTKYEVEI